MTSVGKWLARPHALVADERRQPRGHAEGYPGARGVRVADESDVRRRRAEGRDGGGVAGEEREDRDPWRWCNRDCCSARRLAAPGRPGVVDRGAVAALRSS